MLRATAAPERFLERGLAARVAAYGCTRAARGPRSALCELVVPPPDLAMLLSALGGSALGEVVPAPLTLPPTQRDAPFAAMVRAARTARTRAARARHEGAGAGEVRLLALVAGALPFATSPGGGVWVYVLDGPASPARGAVAWLDSRAPRTKLAPVVVARGAAAFAVRAALEDAAEDAALEARAQALLAKLPTPGIAEEEAVRAAFERARSVVELLVGSDDAVRRAARRLADRPFDLPPPPRDLGSSTRSRSRARDERTDPLALGPVVEAFFRAETGESELAFAHARARDALVRDAVAVLVDAAKDAPRTRLGKDLARRRALATRAVHARTAREAPVRETRLDVTRRIVLRIDALRPVPDPGAATAEREEALLALGELGDGGVLPSLVARAVTGDVAAVDMLGALGDARAIPHLVDLLRRAPQGGLRLLETAAVRALTDLRTQEAAPILREVLAQNPLSGWREGMERGALVRELVGALGTLRDEASAPQVLAILEAKSNEYRHVIPVAAWASGRLRHGPALPALEGLVLSPKVAPSAEAVWAIGEIGAYAPGARDRAAAALTSIPGIEGLDPGVDIVRLTGLAKARAGREDAPSPAELRRALERALWEPAFRQQETSRRQAWALRSLAELARVAEDVFFLGHEAVRYFVTRDDHRVRTAAQAAFAAWGVPLPRTRRYYAFLLDAIEERGGISALHDAVRDPLGVFRHNVATRLAERGHPTSVRPLAEAAARVFAEPATSTYEYDDAPLHVVAFAKALARLNHPEGNAILLDVLRTAHHHVRAVVADNAPSDPAFVPELMAMLGDPRSFLRGRADRALQALGAARASAGESPSRAVPL